MRKLHFEDFHPGDRFDLPSRTITREEIIAFAHEFDPQPFHIDDNAPATLIAGGLIASGWHVCAIYMRLLCDGLLLRAASLGSPGIETLRWPAPVRPGDRLSGSLTVLDTRPSRTRTDRGIVRCRHQAINQAGAVVMRMENPIFFARRAVS
jgi:acyl dehydratase